MQASTRGMLDTEANVSRTDEQLWQSQTFGFFLCMRFRQKHCL